MVDIIYENGERIFFNENENKYYAVKESTYLYAPGVIAFASVLRVFQGYFPRIFGAYGDGLMNTILISILINIVLIVIIILYDYLKMSKASAVRISDVWIRNNMDRIVERYSRQKQALIVGVVFFIIGTIGLFLNASFMFLMMESSGLAFVIGGEHYTRLSKKKRLIDAMKIRLGIQQ